MKKKKPLSGPGAIYARYSSHAQRDCSIEQQVEACKAKAKDLGIEIVAVYADRAVSGKTDNRPEFQKMLRDADEGKFKSLIAWKSNRLGRNMLNAMVNENRLNDAGVKCYYAEEDFDDNAAGRFALRSMMNVNQFYIENMAEDIKRGLLDSAKAGKVIGTIPYGYRKSEDSKYEIHEEEAAIVQEVYRRVANGEPLIDIARNLNDRGITRRKGKKRLPWGKSSFQNLLHNEKYIGVYKYTDIVIPDGIPRIVSDEIYYKVQEVTNTKKNPYRNKRRRTNNGFYLLTGKLFCGKCGSMMVGVSGVGKDRQPHFYYVCQGKRLKHSCDKKNVRRDLIEDVVTEAIRRYALTDNVLDWIADQAVEFSRQLVNDTDLGILREQLSGIEKSLENVMKAIEMGIITETTKKRMQELETEKRTLLRQISEEEKYAVVLEKDDILAGLMLFRDGDFDSPDFRAKLFDTFLKAVYVYEDELKIAFSFTSGDDLIDMPLKDIVDGINEDAECLYKLPSEPLFTSYTNTPWIGFNQGIFVLRIPCPQILVRS